MAKPKHVPAVTIRGPRPGGGGRIEDVSATESELSKLALQIDVPVGVVFDDQRGWEVVLEDRGCGIHVGAPAAGTGFLAFFIETWPSDVWDFFAVDAWDDGKGDVGEGGQKAEHIEFVGACGHIDNVDVSKAKRAVMDCLDALG